MVLVIKSFLYAFLGIVLSIGGINLLEKPLITFGTISIVALIDWVSRFEGH